jgi:alkanesulfonate monooxygenase SsuD/methylene tetrahydromethanopterin reductase-like flavin-dependent oxidoreductase (luciferase family)
MLKHLLYLPPFGDLSDPRLIADLAAEAEAAGWDGVFLWDHVLRKREQVVDVADPWICLAAIAMATSTVRLGPLVTPPTRRRPIKLAREICTLDHLSRGRLTMGFGLGVDSGGELSKFGEETDPRIRADRMDEALTLLHGWLVDGHVDFHGEHFTSDDVLFGPRPVQSPRPPFWFAVRGQVASEASPKGQHHQAVRGRAASEASPKSEHHQAVRGTSVRPARRAARYEGIFPIEMDLDSVKRLLELIVTERGSLDGFDVVLSNNAESGTPATNEEAFAAGATWIAHHFQPHNTAAEIRAHIKSALN